MKSRARQSRHFGMLALLFVSVASGTGCGRMYNDGRIYAPTGSWSPGTSTSSGLTTSTAESNYNCPSGANVLPDNDQEYDGSGRYKICTSKTNTTDILIHGQTYRENVICVFPAQYVDPTHIYAKPDPASASGAIWSQCVDTTSGTVALSFANTTYNAVFISEASGRAQMTQCLAAGNPYLCPYHSYGKFR